MRDSLRYELRYWLEDLSGYIVWETGLSRGDAEAKAHEMRQRRPRNAFTVEVES